MIGLLASDGFESVRRSEMQFPVVCYDFCFRSSPPVVPDQHCRGFSHTNIASSIFSLITCS